MEVAGWGVLDNGTPSDTKLKGVLSLKPIEVYKKKLGRNVTIDQLCAGGEIGRDACKGNYGGPLSDSSLKYSTLNQFLKFITKLVFAVMWRPVRLLLFLYISKIGADKISCTTPEGKQGICVFVDYCPSILNTFVNSNLTRESISELICNNATDSVCCTAPRTSSSYGTELSDRRYCGYQHTDDYSYARNDTAIDEFPWLAVILGIQLDTEEQEEQTMCHGVLINNRYLLSVAHCYTGLNARRYNITRVLLGEYHRNTSEDCVELPEFGITECNEAEQYQIEEMIIHPFYLKRHRLADIALLRLNKAVQFSDYIRPICLPIQGTVFAEVGDVLYTTGWGLETYGGQAAVIKKKIPTVLVSHKECQDAYRNDLPVLPDMSYICTLDFQNNTAYSCQGDSGAPVMFKHKNQWHVEGIVSRGKLCGVSAPGLQVRITSYLEWIKQNIGR